MSLSFFLGEREKEPVISITTPVRNTVSQWKYCHQQFIVNGSILFPQDPQKELEMKEQIDLTANNFIKHVCYYNITNKKNITDDVFF